MTRVSKILIGFFALCMIIISCSLFVDGYYLPFKPCRPLVYDTNLSSGQGSSTFVTSDKMVNVINFYDQHLKQGSVSSFENGVWRKTDNTADLVAYSCSSVDVNMITAETGCIYIIKEINGVRIVSELTRNEGSSVPCQGP